MFSEIKLKAVTGRLKFVSPCYKVSEKGLISHSTHNRPCLETSLLVTV